MKLVLDAKRELLPPTIPNANGAMKNMTAFELDRFIDKRLTSLANQNRVRSVCANTNDNFGEDEQ